MHSSHALAAADAALVDLQTEADFARAEHGDAFADSIMHYHRELLATLTIAFDLHACSSDSTRKKRDRLAHEAHARDIAEHIIRDVQTVRGGFSKVLGRANVTKPGARGVVEALLGNTLNKAETWWDGRMRLGRLTAISIAQRDTAYYRRWW